VPNRLADRASVRYQARVAQVKASIAAEIRTLYADVDPAAIDASMARFITEAEPVIAAGQASVADLTAAFIRASAFAQTGDLLDLADDADDIAGTTRGGAPLREGMGAFGPMVMGQIAQGKTVDEAMAFGEYLASRFADNELTGAGDRSLDAQGAALDAVIGWEGIVAPDACDPCQGNAGRHDVGDEVYRHPGCNCQRVAVFAPATQTRTVEAAAELRQVSEAAEPEVSGILRTLEERTGGELAGFEFRLKAETRIAEKILTDVAEGKGTVEQVGLGINDALRYTLKYEGRATYMDGYTESVRALEAQGIRPLKPPKNFWGKPGYQGINAVFQGPGGARFELQFHTAASLARKDPSHKLYEALRTSTNPLERARLEDEINTLWSDLAASPDAQAFATLPAAP
jgi:hypothetical protein